MSFRSAGICLTFQNITSEVCLTLKANKMWLFYNRNHVTFKFISRSFFKWKQHERVNSVPSHSITLYPIIRLINLHSLYITRIYVSHESSNSYIISFEQSRTNTVHKMNLASNQFVSLAHIFWSCRAIHRENCVILKEWL